MDALEEKDSFTDVSKYSKQGATCFILIKNEEDEASLGMDFCSRCDPFSCMCNNDSDSETTQFALMGKSESKPLEAADQSKLESMENAVCLC